jgi:hypothetical protein
LVARRRGRPWDDYRSGAQEQYNEGVSALTAITALSGLLAVVATCVALLTVRLERMAGATAVATGALALCATVAAGPALGGVVALGGVALFAPVAAGAIVVGLDGRPPRTMRWWKALLVAPLPVLAVAAALDAPSSTLAAAVQPAAAVAGAAPTSDATAGLLCLLALAAAGLSAVLLGRRREAT